MTSGRVTGNHADERLEWTAATHIREAEDTLSWLGRDSDPRNPSYAAEATRALAHAVLAFAIIYNGGKNPATQEADHGF